MKRLRCLALLLCSAPLAAQGPAAGIVQVAVNYGPRQDGFFSGVVVGDGRIVLTDGATAARAREIAIAFSDGEILETVMAQIQSFNHIAVLPMAARHGQIVPLAALAREAAPQGDVEAVAGGALKAFQVDRRGVHLHPVGSGVTLRWQIMPPLPPPFRGGPLLNSQGELIAVIVQEGQTLVGMPLGEMLPMVDAAAPASIKPLETKPTSEPTSGTVDQPSLPDSAKLAADSSVAVPKPLEKVPPTETKTKSTEPPRPAPAEDALSSVFKDSAIAPLHVEAPVVPKPLAVAVSAPRITALNLPLSPIRTAWAWKEAAPPPAAAAPVQRAQQAAQPAAPQVPKADQPKPPATPVPEPSAPRNVEAFLHQAADFMQTKEYPKAVDTLEEAVRQYPDAATLYFQLALAYWYKALQKPDGGRRSTMEKGSYHKAIKSFQTFLEKAPNDPLANEARMRLTVLRNAQYGGGL